MSEIENLKHKLINAHKLFVHRRIDEWASLTRKSIEKLEKNDVSFIEELWLKFAPTCEIDNLIIVSPQLHNPPLSEEAANKLNDELAMVANETFAALQKVRENKK